MRWRRLVAHVKKEIDYKKIDGLRGEVLHAQLKELIKEMDY